MISFSLIDIGLDKQKKKIDRVLQIRQAHRKRDRQTERRNSKGKKSCA